MTFARFTTADFQKLYCDFKERGRETIVASAVMLPGATESLSEIKAMGLKLALVTTKSRDDVDGILTKFGWDVIFDVSVSKDDVREIKPHAEPLAHALKALGAPATSALMVGDTENDIRPAKSIGVLAVAVKPHYGHFEQMKDAIPDETIDDVRQLPDLIRKINDMRMRV